MEYPARGRHLHEICIESQFWCPASDLSQHVGVRWYKIVMPRSVEHDFVTECFIQVADEMSRSEIFGYKEADRGQFDFACVLTRDNSRNLIGQTLTHHAAGIDKDISSLLYETGEVLPVYLYPSESRCVGRVQEHLRNARTVLPDQVSLLRLFEYPVFDADDEQQRQFVAEEIRRKVVDDLLLNVLFGRLQPVDIDLLMHGTGMPGLAVATLNFIATEGFFNFTHLAKSMGVNASTMRPRVQALVTAGMLEQGPLGSHPRATRRARVFLTICHRLLTGNVNAELAYILNRLGLGSHPEVVEAPFEELVTFGGSPAEKRAGLVSELRSAQSNYGTEFTGTGFLLGLRPELPPLPADFVWVGR